MSGKMAPVKSCRIIGREKEAIGAMVGRSTKNDFLHVLTTYNVYRWHIDTFMEGKSNGFLSICCSYDHI